jgi:hypothetical protein
MNPLPATSLLSNVATWAVPTGRVPDVVGAMLATPLLKYEKYDLLFRGQKIETLYFDSPNFDLRKARVQGERYLTHRLRSYGGETFALAAKTENEKWRQEVPPEQVADFQMDLALLFELFLPAHLLARLQELAKTPLMVVSTVCCTRFAVEDDTQRLTLDVGVSTEEASVCTRMILSTRPTLPPLRSLVASRHRGFHR